VVFLNIGNQSLCRPDKICCLFFHGLLPRAGINGLIGYGGLHPENLI
jgi:hypothetical protein